MSSNLQFPLANQFHVNNRRCLLLDPYIHLYAAVFNTKLTSKFKHHGKRNLMLRISPMLHSLYMYIYGPHSHASSSMKNHGPPLVTISQIAFDGMTLSLWLYPLINHKLAPLPCTYINPNASQPIKDHANKLRYASSFTQLWCTIVIFFFLSG